MIQFIFHSPPSSFRFSKRQFYSAPRAVEISHPRSTSQSYCKRNPIRELEILIFVRFQNVRYIDLWAAVQQYVRLSFENFSPIIKMERSHFGLRYADAMARIGRICCHRNGRTRSRAGSRRTCPSGTSAASSSAQRRTTRCCSRSGAYDPGVGR